MNRKLSKQLFILPGPPTPASLLPPSRMKKTPLKMMMTTETERLPFIEEEDDYSCYCLALIQDFHTSNCFECFICCPYIAVIPNFSSSSFSISLYYISTPAPGVSLLQPFPALVSDTTPISATSLFLLLRTNCTLVVIYLVPVSDVMLEESMTHNSLCWFLQLPYWHAYNMFASSDLRVYESRDSVVP